MQATTRFPQLQTPVGTLGFCQRVVNLPGFFCRVDVMSKQYWKLRGIPLRERFDANYKVDSETGCWLWQGCLNRGYGQMRVCGKLMASHRVSYILFRGSIPKRKCVLHSCDVPRCVNPGHLWIGTQLDNISDCVSKNRTPHGEKHFKAKLSEDDVRFIRSSYPNITGVKLAIMFGVCSSTISEIISRKYWKRIEDNKS